MLLFNWIAMVFVWFMCPETTGKSLEEIDLLFAKDYIRESVIAGQLPHSSGSEKEPGMDQFEKV